MVSVAKFVINFLQKKGIKIIPVYQGGAVMNFIDEIGKNNNLKYIVPYHEQSLSMQVDTLARLNGFAAGFATSGPGATNLLTGVCSAYYDSIPCFYFTGQVGQLHLKKNRGVRQLGFQETDVIKVFKPITKYAVQINDASKIAYELEKGYHKAFEGRPGPVIFDIPFNIQKTQIDLKKIKKYKTVKKNKNKISNKKQKIKRLVNLLNKSKKPLILVGGGIKRSFQEKNFLKFVKKNNIPFATTWMSQHLFDHKNPLYLGSIGKSGHRSANEIASKSDFIICLGQRFAVKNILSDFGKNAKIFAVDIDKNELENGLVKPNFQLKILLQDFFKIILKEKNILKTNHTWTNYTEEVKKKLFKVFVLHKKKSERKKHISVYNFFDVISPLISKKSLIFPDAGANQVWFFQSFLQKYGQTVINHSGHAPMGHAIPASIGGYYSKKSKGKKIIVFIGDGGLMMNLQELEYIKNFRIPIKIVVLNNRCLGNTKLGSILSFNGRTHANDKKNGYHPPNIKDISKAFNIKYFEFKNGSNNSLKKKFREFIASNKPSLLNLLLSETQNVAELHVLNRENKKFFI